MNWYHTIAASRAPDLKLIGTGTPERPYLQRWWLSPRDAKLGCVYLHKYLGSDDDRALHDHPWHSTSFMLAGELLEIDADNPNGKIVRAGDVRVRTPEYAHRLQLVSNEAWTLFMRGPVQREWGFHCPQGWKHWRDFTDAQTSGDGSGIGAGCGDD